MTFYYGKKLTDLRESFKTTTEFLFQLRASVNLSVSRQTLKKWEAKQSYPDAIQLEKLEQFAKYRGLFASRLKAMPGVVKLEET